MFLLIINIKYFHFNARIKKNYSGFAIWIKLLKLAKNAKDNRVQIIIVLRK